MKQIWTISIFVVVLMALLLASTMPLVATATSAGYGTWSG